MSAATEFRSPPAGRRRGSFAPLLGFGAGIVLVAVLGLAGYRNMRAVESAFEWTAHTYQVLADLDELEASAVAAESARRGFALTGNAAMLAPFQQALRQAFDAAARVRRLTADNPAQQRRLDALEPVLRRRTQLLIAAVDARRLGWDDARETRNTVEGAAAARALTDAIAATRDEERTLLARRLAATRSGMARTVPTLAAGTGGAILLLTLGFLLLRRENERRRVEMAERRLAEQERDRVFELSIDLVGVATLEGRFVRVNPAFERTLGHDAREMTSRPFFDFVHPDDVEATRRELARLGRGELTRSFENRCRCKDGTYRWLQWAAVPDPSLGVVFAIARDTTRQKQTQIEFTNLNQELETNVRAVTAANAELESFSYSVSHDLRAPLRAIDGFGAALLEDYGATFPPEARSMLDRMRAASRRMGQLIDDLLRLSRITRTELRLATVDVSAICRAIVDELRPRRPEPRVAVAIADGLTARADPHLARIAFENLLENAWKFVRPSSAPCIEVGAAGGEIFVRDNGVGFDPAHAARLFQPFERLHRSDQFEGTGIGLATVARVVARHGGHVRAEGRVGGGATFYLAFFPENGDAARTGAMTSSNPS